MIRTLVLGMTLLALVATTAEATPVTFRYRATTAANSVHLAGSFNQWDMGATPMENHDGVWEVTVDLPPGRHQYKYVVDGSKWITDEWASEFSDDGFGGQNSVVVVGDEPMAAGYGSREVGPDGETVESIDPGTRVTFHYRPDSRVNAVSVAGTWNGWDAAVDVMADDDGDGIWSVTVDVEPGEHAYQFVVDGDLWIDAGPGEGTEPDGFGGRRPVLVVGDESIEVGP